MRFKFNDGGKAEACLGTARSSDCGIRAAAIALGQGYRKTKSELNELLKEMTGGLERSCNDGTPAAVLHRYLTDRGWVLVLTPKGYLDQYNFAGMSIVACLPRHNMAILDNVVNDTWDSRFSRRTKSGSQRLEGYYWRPEAHS